MTAADEDAQTASELLSEFGEPVTIIFPGVASYDPVTGEAGTGSPEVTYAANAYPGQYQTSELDGTVIKANDIRLILERIAQRPQAGCLAIVDGLTYRVMAARPIREGGQDVIYICQLRIN